MLRYPRGPGRECPPIPRCLLAVGPSQGGPPYSSRGFNGYELRMGVFFYLVHNTPVHTRADNFLVGRSVGRANDSFELTFNCI
jgi:hypothetical protein